MNRSKTGPGAATLEFSAPGRVNLIGEHTDYTGGLVMPMAIPFTSTVLLKSAADGRYTFRSDDFANTKTFATGDRSGRSGDWTDYPVGVLRELQALHIEPPPFDLHISGNVPLGSGLSSSASVEVATAIALLAYSGAEASPQQIATLCQRAENRFVGSPCGIMDQFVVAAARAGHALLLHTRDLTYELLPMNTGGLADCRVVVANSGVKHQIRDGGYPERRQQLEDGQAVLLHHFPDARDLGEASIGQLRAVENEMDPKSFLRCRHVITENARVRDAAEAMLAGDPVRLGKIMVEAHASERDDFECSVPKIDFLVDTAMTLPGCHGARLTGGGFGGCTVNLVDAALAEQFSGALRDAYRKQYGDEPGFKDAETYICEAVDGAVARAGHVEAVPC